MNTKIRQHRIGIYAWAGPGTIRLLETKYFHPKIDRESFLSAYDLPYLSRLKELFDVTDAWVTYSWGFFDQREEEDYHFLRERLGNFKALGIRTHAYVQGLNVVTADFADQDFFCRDPWGRKITYSKGRSFLCPNHPETLALVEARLQRACAENIDGVFIDNILFGLPPFTVSSDLLPFFGCSCMYCQKAFLKKYGYALPRNEKCGKEITDFLRFRSDTMRNFVSRCATICKREEKEFGINLYDPTLRLDTLYYGYDLKKISDFLDYFLIENHALSEGAPLFPGLPGHKPTFVVSYDQGIGYEPQFTQEHINAVFSQAECSGYFPCLKTTEFTTEGVWHMLSLDSLTKPKREDILPAGSTHLLRANKSTPMQRLLIKKLSKPILSSMNRSQTSRIFSAIATGLGIHKAQVRKARTTTL